MTFNPLKNRLRQFATLIAGFLIAQASYGGAYEEFFSAVQHDNDRVVAGLLERSFDPNTVSPEGVPALLLAFKFKSYKAAATLIGSKSVNVEVRTPQDESPLMLAALGGQIELCQSLLLAEADVNKPGWTPLHYAATGGHTAIVRLLLEHHAYIDAESPNGTTPLMMAARYGNYETVALLLSSGADASLKNQLGLSAMDFAKGGQKPDSAQLLELRATPPIKPAAHPKGEW